MAKAPPKYLVLRDTREQLGWDFPAGSACLGTEKTTLKTGDYTLKGFEESFVVERKHSTAEVSQNIVQSRFERELARLEKFDFPFMVCSFTLADVINFPVGSGIPEENWDGLKITPRFFLKRLNEYQLAYRTRIIFAGEYGREFASSLFKRVVERGL